MSKLPKDKRDKIVLVTLLTVAASTAIWFALINLQRQALAETRKQRDAAKQQLSQGEATLARSASVQREFQTIGAKLISEEATMAAPTDMYSWLIQTIKGFCTGRDVDIPQFSRETATEIGIFPTFPYRAAAFTIRGNAYYHDFGKFLAEFENQYPYIRVQNIELEPVGDSAPNVSGFTREKLTFKLELVTLVRPITP